MVALPLTVLPFRSLLLALAASVDLAIAIALVRTVGARRKKQKDESVVSLDSTVPVALRRRTEPRLRARHPVGIVEMQVRWRQAAEAHRRARRRDG